MSVDLKKYLIILKSLTTGQFSASSLMRFKWEKAAMFKGSSLYLSSFCPVDCEKNQNIVFIGTSFKCVRLCVKPFLYF